MRHNGAGPPHSANQPSTSAAFVTCAERAVRADGASTARGFDVRPGRDHLLHAVQLVDEPGTPGVRVLEDDEVLARRALEGRARRGERYGQM